jgi:uncharacterized surface protein with fasciclin (FAS1) repeats
MRILLFLPLILFFFINCGGRQNNEALNDPEIVPRDSDTVFHEVPGEGHSGIGEFEDYPENILETLSANPSFSTFLSLLNQTDIADKLTEDGPATVFAPTNEAFSALGEARLEQLMDAGNSTLLTEMLQYHVVEGIIDFSAMADGEVLTAKNGQELNIQTQDGNFQVNEANIQAEAMRTENGIIYRIDKVLVPVSR